MLPEVSDGHGQLSLLNKEVNFLISQSVSFFVVYLSITSASNFQTLGDRYADDDVFLSEN